MKKFMILAIVMLSGATFMAQAETKEASHTVAGVTEKTVEKTVTKEVTHQGALDALNRRDFVLQAHGIANAKGASDVAEVNSSLNFIAVKGDKGLSQISPPTSKYDNTPQSEVTMQMDIVSCDVETDKRGNVTCLLSAMMDGTEKQFKIKLNKKGNKAVAEYKGSSFAFVGELLPGEVSEINIGSEKG